MNEQVYTLICEGPCNPTITVVDRLLQDADILHGTAKKWGHGEEYLDSKRQRLLPPDLQDFTRRLVYTPHVMSRQNHARCMTCGTERRYGFEYGV